MPANLEIDPALLFAFLCVLARVSGVVLFVPIPGFPAVSTAGRIVFSVVLSFAMLSAWHGRAAQALSVSGILVSVLCEIAVGLTLGVAVSFFLEAVQLASQMIGLQAGYSYASTIDPTTAADTTTLQVLCQLFAGTLFFGFGFDRQLFRILAKSFQSIPLGTFSLTPPVALGIARLGGGIFAVGLQLAIPVIALLLLLDLTFAVLGRLQTQLQVLSLSFTVKMLAALGFLSSTIVLFPAAFEKSGSATFTALWDWIGR